MRVFRTDSSIHACAFRKCTHSRFSINMDIRVKMIGHLLSTDT